MAVFNMGGKLKNKQVEKAMQLSKELGGQFEDEKNPEKRIRKNLKSIGYNL